MKCPNCGHTMNHHADKLQLEIIEHEDGPGVPQIEAYTCPHCGTNATQLVSNG